MPETLLVVEDDPEIAELLRFTLNRAGFEVKEALSAERAFEQIDASLPALLVLDWMLPGMDGVEFAKRLRRDELTQELPILMLTARSEEADKLKSFDVGGVDDYLTKPFSGAELVARVKALLRRSGSPVDRLVRSGTIALDMDGRRLTIDGALVAIGPTEYRLLELFVRNPDRVFERDQIMDRVWGRNSYIEDRTVDVHVLRLRRLRKPHGQAEALQTVRGVGYRFSPQAR